MKSSSNFKERAAREACPRRGSLFEAAKYCAYFITHDQRILDRAGKLHEVLPPSLTVLTLAEFLQIFDDFEAGRRL